MPQGEVTWKQEPEQSTWKTVPLLTQRRGQEDTEDLEKGTAQSDEDSTVKLVTN